MEVKVTGALSEVRRPNVPNLYAYVCMCVSV